MKAPNVQPLDEAALVRRFVRHRDESSFRALYRAHTPAMFAVAWRYLGGDRVETDDVVQDAWCRAAEGLAGFRGESSLRTWLIGITINCARNRARERAARSRRETGLAAVADLPSPAPVAAPAALVDLERAIAELPDGYREAVLLHDVFGFTHDEIAGMLGVDSGTSRSQLSRARSTLRRRLHEKGQQGHERRSEQETE